MFFKNKNDVYIPFGKSDQKVYKPSPYDDEKSNPFEEIAFPIETNFDIYKTNQILDVDTISKDYILEYVLKEYS